MSWPSHTLHTVSGWCYKLINMEREILPSFWESESREDPHKSPLLSQREVVVWLKVVTFDTFCFFLNNFYCTPWSLERLPIIGDGDLEITLWFGTLPFRTLQAGFVGLPGLKLGRYLQFDPKSKLYSSLHLKTKATEINLTGLKLNRRPNTRLELTTMCQCLPYGTLLQTLTNSPQRLQPFFNSPNAQSQDRTIHRFASVRCQK